jgi:hypothetical protein
VNWKALVVTIAITAAACQQGSTSRTKAPPVATAKHPDDLSPPPNDHGAMELDPDKIQNKQPPWPSYIPPLPARTPCPTSCDLSTDEAVAAKLHLITEQLPWVDRPAPGVVIVGANATDLARDSDEVFIDGCPIAGRFYDDDRVPKIAHALGWDHADSNGRAAIAWLLVDHYEQLEALDTTYHNELDPFPDPRQLHDPTARALVDGGVELEVWYHSLGLGKFVHARIQVDSKLKLTTERIGTLPSKSGPI